MYESISLKKIKNMAVLRINNMIPVVDNVIHEINFNLISDKQYKTLLQNEYRIIKAREREIRTDARIVYFYRLNDNNKHIIIISFGSNRKRPAACTVVVEVV